MLAQPIIERTGPRTLGQSSPTNVYRLRLFGRANCRVLILRKGPIVVERVDASAIEGRRRRQLMNPSRLKLLHAESDEVLQIRWIEFSCLARLIRVGQSYPALLHEARSRHFPRCTGPMKREPRCRAVS